jgi:hypothetical protein
MWKLVSGGNLTFPNSVIALTQVPQALPPGGVSKGIFPHGSSYRSRTVAIAADENGQPRRFFLKVRWTISRAQMLGLTTSRTGIVD